MAPPAAEWDAQAYHRISDPQLVWGRAVLARLPLAGDETVLDAGCGTGRVTAELLDRLPRGRVIALDASRAMLEAARAHLEPLHPGRVTYLHAALEALDLDGAADVVFSASVFHWVPDQARLFANLFRALRPGGLLEAQCGGAGTLRRLHARAEALGRRPPFAPAFAGFRYPAAFPDGGATAARLRAAGLAEVDAAIADWPVPLGDAAAYATFVEKSILGPYLAELAGDELRRLFVAELTAQAAADDPPFVLDCRRLDLHGRRPA